MIALHTCRSPGEEQWAWGGFRQWYVLELGLGYHWMMHARLGGRWGRINGQELSVKRQLPEIAALAAARQWLLCLHKLTWPYLFPKCLSMLIKHTSQSWGIHVCHLLTVSEASLGVLIGTLELTCSCEGPACCWCSWLLLLDQLGSKPCPQALGLQSWGSRESLDRVWASQVLSSYFTQSRTLLQLFKFILMLGV